MKVLLIAIMTWMVNLCLAQQNHYNPDKKYVADSAKANINDLMKELARKHPGFYRYRTKEQWRFKIDSTYGTIMDSLTEFEIYKKIKPLIAYVGCLHTGVTLSKAASEYLEKSKTRIPIEVFIARDHRVFVTKDKSNILKPGTEIVAIDSVPITDIITRLSACIPSDGYNQTEKIRVLNHRFPDWYQSLIRHASYFTVVVLEDGIKKSYTLPGVDGVGNWEDIFYGDNKILSYTKTDNVASLKVRSFANTTTKHRDQHYKRYLKKTFKDLRKSNAENLVVDVRNNSGGTDGNAVLLVSYLMQRPFRYWDHLEITPALAKDFKWLARFIYGRPIKKDSVYHLRKLKFSREFDFYQTQRPSKNAFKGNVYILANGLCMSSCSDFVAVLSHNKRAMVIGEETGGGYHGNTSGIMPTVVLPPAGLVVTVPLVKYVTFTDPTVNIGRGTIPDKILYPTFEEWVQEKDIEMEYVKSIILKK